MRPDFLRRLTGTAQDDGSQGGRSDGLRDIILFGRVISGGLVVAGYVFLGVWLMSRLNESGWPSWIVYASVPACLAFGLWQGWMLLKNIRNSRKK